VNRAVDEIADDLAWTNHHGRQAHVPRLGDRLRLRLGLGRGATGVDC